MRHQRASVVWVCQYPETAWCRLAALAPSSEVLFRPVDSGLAGEQPDLVCVVAQPAAEGVAGVVAVVPVAVPVVRDPEGDGLVVALAELGQQFRVGPGLISGPGPGGRLMGLAQDLDHIAGPGLQAAGAQLGDRAAPADHVRFMPISA
jgi:hypothetical protein